MECFICGKDTGRLFSKMIGTDARICRTCYNLLPSEMKKQVNRYDTEYLKTYIESVKLRHGYIIKAFKRTARYGDMVLDEHIGYIAFTKKLVDGGLLPDDCYDVFGLSDVEDMSFAVTNPVWTKGGMHADVEIYIKLHYPDIDFRKIIKSDDVCKIIKTDSDGNCTYQAPELLLMFESLINRAWERALNNRNLDEYFGAVKEQEYALAKATLLVGDGYDLDEIKKQRNRLIKTFHPDSVGNENDAAYYSQKINNAYCILKNRLREENNEF